jgi:putative ABC transport system substrate-binding protein
MRRAVRLIVAFALGFLAAALPAAAQELKPKRVGVVLQGGPYSTGVDGLREGLRAAGLEEGRQWSLVARDAKGDLKAAEMAAKDLEFDGADVIVAITTSVAIAAKRGTTRVPIVFVAGADPVAFVPMDSVAKPGGRLTGIHSILGDITAKRLEILRELLPMLRRVVTFYNPRNQVATAAMQSARDAAQHLGVELIERHVTSPEEIRERLHTLSAGEADAYFFAPDSTVTSHETLILEKVSSLRIPTMAYQLDIVANGALAGYGSIIVRAGRLAARYVTRILTGSDPAELPVEAFSQPALLINLKTAAALALTIPSSILARADEVIE